eukprot:2785294-Prorocentrum_lima.AAC.1
MTSSLVGSEMCIRDRKYRSGSLFQQQSFTAPKVNSRLLRDRLYLERGGNIGSGLPLSCTS